MMINFNTFKAAAKSLAPTTADKAVLGGATIALVAAGVNRSRSVEQVVKPLVMGAIAAGLWKTRDQRCAADNALLGVAVGASLIGDQLMLEEEFAADQADADEWMRRGASAFAVNHVATVSLALRHGARPGVAEVAPRAIGLIEGLLVLAARRRHMLAPLGAYSKLLAVMSAVMASPQLNAGVDDSDPRNALELGGMLFLASDATILHRQVFLGRDSEAGAVAEGWVLLSYCAAQALIFSGLAKLASARVG